MHRILKVILVLAITVIGVVIATLYFQGKNFEVLNTAGQIGDQQRNLIYFTVALSLLIIFPVLALTFYITWKYRATNPKARYTPEWDGSTKLEAIWWLIPLAVIILLAVVTWNTSHSLDPRKPIESSAKPLKVQVVALEWKWLFIYPEEKVATVNYLMIPEDRPIEFNITADAPMNSFWIPQLGGQIYAMTGMSTTLHLMADHTGTYRGQSANLSGEGFADMTFNAHSVSQSDFNAWATKATQADAINYTELVAKSHGDDPIDYSVAQQPMLYTDIVNKYAHHGTSGHTNKESH